MNHNGNQRDFEESVLDGTIKVPHESFDKLIAMVRDQLRQGAPTVSWAIDGVAEGQELPANVEAALRAYFDAPTMPEADEVERRETFDHFDVMLSSYGAFDSTESAHATEVSIERGNAS